MTDIRHSLYLLRFARLSNDIMIKWEEKLFAIHYGLIYKLMLHLRLMSKTHTAIAHQKLIYPLN